MKQTPEQELQRGYQRWLREDFAAELLLAGASIAEVSQIVGDKNCYITEKRYRPLLHAMQIARDNQLGLSS